MGGRGSKNRQSNFNGMKIQGRQSVNMKIGDGDDSHGIKIPTEKEKRENFKKQHEMHTRQM